MDVINVHGNKGLTNQEISLTELECLAKDITKLPKLYLPYVAEADLLCLATGIFSPLHGFMGKDDYLSVTREMRLKDGTLWPVPITLPVPLEKETLIKNANYALLLNQDQEACAIIRIEELYFVDLEEEAQSVFGTTSL
ncbi:MAG: sulfate adenylyltransferase, partial [Bacillota bacterium]